MGWWGQGVIPWCLIWVSFQVRCCDLRGSPGQDTAARNHQSPTSAPSLTPEAEKLPVLPHEMLLEQM